MRVVIYVNKNNKIIIGVILISIIICICIIIFNKKDYKRPKEDKIPSFGSHTKFGKEYKDPNGVEIVLDTLSADHCTDNICVSITKISCNDNRGMIFFKLKNTGSSKTSGKAIVRFPGRDVSILYENLDIGSTYDSSYLYENANLKQVTDFLER